MASFYLNITGSGQTTADVYGQFTGGEPTYSYSRRVKIYVYSGGSFYNDYYITSDESSGATSTFDWGIGSLQPSTTYTYTATLQYWSGSWTDSSYTDSGSFTTYAPTPTTYSATLMFNERGGTPHYSDRTNTSSTTSVAITTAPAPTKPGFVFLYWHCSEDGNDYAPNTSYNWTGSTYGESYNLVAVWGGATIFDGTNWQDAKPTIYDGTDWDDATPSLYDGTNWK